MTAENEDQHVSSATDGGEDFLQYTSVETGPERIAKALEVVFSHGQTDGAHHKAWAIDQVVRELTGEKYDDFVNFYQFGVTDPEKVAKAKIIAEGDYYEGDFTDEEIEAVESMHYDWDTGIPG